MLELRKSDLAWRGALPSLALLLAACHTSRAIVSHPPSLEVETRASGDYRARWNEKTTEEWVLELRSEAGRCTTVDLTALAALTPRSPELLDYIDTILDGPPGRSRKLDAARALVFNYPCDVSLPRLVRMLHEPDGYARGQVALLLAECPAAAERIVPLLIDQLDDVEQGSGPIEALGKLGALAKPAVPALLERLPDSNDHIRTELLKALSRIEPRELAPLPYLLEYVAAGDCYIWASDALARYGQAAVDAVLPILREEGKPRFCALHVLAKLSPRATVPLEPLAALLDDPLVDNRGRVRQIISTLGEAGGPLTDRWLTDLQSGDQKVVAAARRVLTAIGSTATPKLLPLLRSPSAQVRRAVPRILSSFAPTPEILEALATLSADEDPRVRLEAAHAGAVLDTSREVDAVAELKQAFLSDDDELVRRATEMVRELGQRAGQLAPFLLQEMERHPNRVYLLSLMGPGVEVDVTRLVGHLESSEADDLGVFRGLTRTIAVHGSRGVRALPALLKNLERESDEYPDRRRVAALEAIAAMGPSARSAIDALEKLLDDDAIRAEVALTMVAIDPDARERVVPRLREHLARSHPHDTFVPRRRVFDVFAPRGGRFEALAPRGGLFDSPPRNERRVRACRALWQITGEAHEVLPALIEEMRPRPRASSRPDVLDLLGEIGPAAVFARPWVERAMREYAFRDGRTTKMFGWRDQRNFHGRLTATRALSRIVGDPSLLEAFLLRHFEEGDVEDIQGGYTDSVRQGCVDDFAALGGAVVPELAEFLETGDPVLRYYTIRALGAIGPAARETLPALQTATGDKHAAIRREARKARDAVNEGV